MEDEFGGKLLEGSLAENANAVAAGGPDGGVGGAEQSEGIGAGGGGQMGNAGIVADVESGAGQDRGERIEGGDDLSAGQMLVGRGKKAHGAPGGFKPAGEGLEALERPILAGAATEGVDVDEAARLRIDAQAEAGWNGGANVAGKKIGGVRVCVRGQRGIKENSRMQRAEGGAELVAIGAIPGMDFIKGGQTRGKGRRGRLEAEQTEARAFDRVHGIGKQGMDFATRP